MQITKQHRNTLLLRVVRRRVAAIIVMLLTLLCNINLQAQSQCTGITFNIDAIEPCQFQLTYDNSSECFIEIRLTLEQGTFDDWTINASDGFTIEIISASELWIHHNAGFIPIGYHEPILFSLPANLITPMYIGYLDNCPPGAGCEVFPSPILEACTEPQTASITGTLYSECEGDPYDDQPTLSDWLIELSDSSGTVISEAFTDNDGVYAFHDLPAGSYIVTEVVEPEWIPNVPDNGQAVINVSASEEVIQNFGNCRLSCFANFTFQDNGCGNFSFFGIAAGIAPFTYAWDFGDPPSGVSNFSTIPTPSHQFTSGGPHTVMLTITDGGGCSAIFSAVLNVPTISSISISANPGLTICQGQTSTLTANGGPGSTYVWNNTNTTQSILVGGADTYCVTVTDVNGCTSSSCAILSVTPVPIATITGNLILCFGGVTTLTAHGGGTYVWNNGGSTSASITVNPVVSTNYIVTVTANGCQSIASASVLVDPNLTVTTGADKKICLGQSAVIVASKQGGTGPFTYLWNPGAVSGNPLNTGPIQQTTTYTVQVTDAYGCTASDIITVTVNPVPVVNAGNDTIICAGEFASLYASFAGGTPPYNFNWNNFIPYNPNVVSPGSNETYTIAVTDANGCKATDDVEVELMNCCSGSLAQNWDFNTGGTALGNDFIWSANNWEGIWSPGPGTNRNGDYWDLNSILIFTGPVCGLYWGPFPASQGKYAGFYCHYGPGISAKPFRQGILNNLSSSISPNSGFYKVTMQIACPCATFGLAKMVVYGVRTGQNSTTIPVFGFPNGPNAIVPSNGNLFGTSVLGGGAKELGTINISNKKCGPTFTTYSFIFNSATLSGPIDRIFLTRKDIIAGSSYLGVDDVCIQKVDDAVGNHCDCGPFVSTYFYQAGTNIQGRGVCKDSIYLPCRKQGSNTRISVNFPCSSNSCQTNSSIIWELNGPSGFSTGIANMSSLFSNVFNIQVPWSYLGSTGGTYTLTLTRQCGSKICKCEMYIIIAPCPCLCDDNFRLDVNQGFSVTGASMAGPCSRNLKPIALCPNDVVTWSVAGGGTYGPTTGNNQQQIPFITPGSYDVCMAVRRYVNGIECGVRENCRTVNVNCGNDPNGTIYKSCLLNKLRNGDFTDTSMVSGLLGEFGNLSDWEIAYNFGDGQVIVDDSSGADDAGHIILVGGSGNIAGLAQELAIDTSTVLTIAYSLKNYSGANTPPGSKLIIRLQSHIFPEASYQTIYEQEIDSSDGDWTRNELTLDVTPDTSLIYIVFSVINADTSQRTTIGLDNLEACTDEIVSTSHITATSLLRLYPNPASTSLFVDIPALSAKNISLQIVNVTGEIVMYKETQGNTRQAMDIAKLAQGIYFVQLLSGNHLLSVEKFIKM